MSTNKGGRFNEVFTINVESFAAVLHLKARGEKQPITSDMIESVRPSVHRPSVHEPMAAVEAAPAEPRLVAL